MGLTVFGLLTLLLSGALYQWWRRQRIRFGAGPYVVRPRPWVRVSLRSVGVLMGVSAVVAMISGALVPIPPGTGGPEGIDLLGLGMVGLALATLVGVFSESLGLRIGDEGLLIQGVLARWDSIRAVRKDGTSMLVVGDAARWNQWLGYVRPHGAFFTLEPGAVEAVENARTRARQETGEGD